MKKFEGYEEAKKASGASNRLPEGAYIAKILGVRYEEGNPGMSDMIRLMFDISEGDYSGYYKKAYDADESTDKWWKGATTVWVPKDDGSQKDEWTKNAFAKWTDSLEKSNNGYTWDWDEQKWKGLTVGLVFRSAGKVSKDGNEYKFTEVAFPIDAQTVRDGKAPSAKFKAYKGYTGKQISQPTEKFDASAGIDANVEEEIPF